MKRLASNLSKTQVEMTASSKMSAIIDEKYPQQSTTSIKVDILTRGLKSESTKAFIQSIIGRSAGNNSGSYSFKIPTSLAEQNISKLEEIASLLHKETDFILTSAYNMLTEEQKARGEMIAQQNVMRNEMVRLLGDAADATQIVDNWLETNNQLYIPDTVQIEATLKGGHRSYIEPTNAVGYKHDIAADEPGSPEVWRRTSEIYGRKRVPLYTDEAVKVAYEGIASLAAKWEEFWKKQPMDTAEQILDGVYAFVQTLEHRDHIIETSTLGEEKVVKAKKIAADNVTKMRKTK